MENGESVVTSDLGQKDLDPS